MEKIIILMLVIGGFILLIFFLRKNAVSKEKSTIKMCKWVENNYPIKFKEPEFQKISWGMSQDEVQKSYQDAILVDIPKDDIAQPNIHGLTYFSQALFGTLYKHTAILGFCFSERGLFQIVTSFHFVTEDSKRKLRVSEILVENKKIFKALKNLYGNPSYYLAENGVTLSCQWVFENTYIHFAYDGDNSWGIHYRSMKLDPVIQEILNHTRNEFANLPTNDLRQNTNRVNSKDVTDMVSNNARRKIKEYVSNGNSCSVFLQDNIQRVIFHDPGLHRPLKSLPWPLSAVQKRFYKVVVFEVRNKIARPQNIFSVTPDDIWKYINEKPHIINKYDFTFAKFNEALDKFLEGIHDDKEIEDILEIINYKRK